LFKALLICYYSRAHAASARAAGSEAGTPNATNLARLTGLDVACISRRHDAAIRRSKEELSFRNVIAKVMEEYQE
jgi:hypothetical protein